MNAQADVMRIGIDFDNTLIGYDEVFLAAAGERQLLAQGFSGNKQAVRDAIRLLPDGEMTWQRLQGHVYGKGIGGAVIFEGANAFLSQARAAGHTLFIVSHKTEYGHHDPDRVNLRAAARAWMEAQGFFDEPISIARGNVFFETTRADKLARITTLGCTHFIDDLEEVLGDPNFPADVQRILFSTSVESSSLPFIVCPNWQRITDVLLNDRA